MCSGKQRHPLCRSPRGSQLHRTMDAGDKQALGKRSCGRSRASFYNRKRPHSSLDARTPDRAYFDSLPLVAAACEFRRRWGATTSTTGRRSIYRKRNTVQTKPATSGDVRLSTPVIHLWNPSSRSRSLARLQCACADRYGKLTGRDRRGPCPIRDHRHHRVPTVDTLVTQHLITTIAAAKLMGADCICSGIRPQIAQIIVQLGSSTLASRPRRRWPMRSPWRCAA